MTSTAPLDTSSYTPGRSDEAVPVHHEPVPAEKPVEKTDTLGRITSLFRKSTAHDDYPHGLQYEGPTTSTHMVNDIDRHPLDHHVSVYHSGRSDEAVPVHHEPVPAEKPVEKTDTLGRITSLFKKSTAHEDYPQAVSYEGPVSETGRVHEISGAPLDTHVSVYHSGRSDEAVPVHHEPVPAEKPVEKTDTLGRITSLFRKSTAHDDYPHGLQYEGPTTSTHMVNDIDRHPLDHHVSVYHSGRSDEAVPVHHEPVPAEKPVEKTGPFLSSEPKVNEETFQDKTVNAREINGFYDKPPSGLSHVRAVSFDRSAGRDIDSVNRHSPRGQRDARAKELGSFSTHEHAFCRTVPRMRTSHSYSDHLVSRRGASSSGGWTTVTETTTITYAKKTSASRIIGGRTQHVTEDIIVYDHGRGTLPPLSPTFRRIANGGRNYSPNRPAYYNVDQRYNYYRSRSQDPLRSVRAEDKGFQTDFDSINNLDSIRLPTAQAEEDTRRHSRSLSRTARSATTDIQTYRSYSSHLYNRHDYIDDYDVRYRWPSQERSDITSNVQESGVDSQNSKRTSYRMPSLSPPMRRSELYAKHDRDRREGRQFGTQTRSVDYRSDADGVCTAYRSMSPSKTNGHTQQSTFSATIDRSSPTKFPVHTTTVYKRPYQQHSSVSPSTARKLHYQRSNLEELPIDQLFSQLGDDDSSPYEYRNGGKVPVIQPLESRLIDPGYYAGPETSTAVPQRSEADVKVPMKKARQRVRNYCAML
ncbi:hypothetical protein Ddc_00388 [Ditylenchus destructor]|nr:hypothetical protein Ddc_00388 [Ditylenchus destructor]